MSWKGRRGPAEASGSNGAETGWARQAYRPSWGGDACQHSEPSGPSRLRKIMQHVRSYCPSASEVHPPASGQRGSKGPAGCRAAAHSAAEAPPPRCGVSLAQGHCRRARGAACGLYTSPEGSPSGFDAWKRHSIWRREGEQPLKSSCGLLALDLPQQSSTRSCGRACKGEVRREPAPNWWLSLGPVLTSGWGILAWLPPHPPPLLWVLATSLLPCCIPLVS